MPKTGSAVAKSKKAGELASSGKSRKAADKGDLFVHHEGMTVHEFTAYKEYQSAYYQDINAHLREGPFAHLALPEAVARIPHLKSLLGKQSFARETTVYRGMAAYEGFDPSQFKAGDVYEARGLFSASLKKSVAEGFTDKLDPKSQSVLFHIKVPKGTKAIPGYKIQTGSTFQQSEKEIVFAHESRIKLGKVRKDKWGVFHFHGTFE
jgi:hypothetical protein